MINNKYGIGVVNLESQGEFLGIQIINTIVLIIVVMFLYKLWIWHRKK